MLLLALATSVVMFAVAARFRRSEAAAATPRSRLTLRELVFLTLIVSIPAFMLAGDGREWVRHGMAAYWPYVALALWAVPFVVSLLLWPFVAAAGAHPRSPPVSRQVIWVCALAGPASGLALAHWALPPPNPLLEMAGWWAFSGVVGAVWACHAERPTAARDGPPPRADGPHQDQRNTGSRGHWGR